MEPALDVEIVAGAARRPLAMLGEGGIDLAFVELVAAGFGVSILARWAVAPQIGWGSIAAAPLTAEGLAIDWYAALRARDGPDSPGHRLAVALAAGCGRDARRLRRALARFAALARSRRFPILRAALATWGISA